MPRRLRATTERIAREFAVRLSLWMMPFRNMWQVGDRDAAFVTQTMQRSRLTSVETAPVGLPTVES